MATVKEIKSNRWGTIEHKDAKGNILSVEEGLILTSGGGDEKTVITVEEVEDLASLWCSYKEMAEFFDVNVETFKYNFKKTIAKGRNETKQSLRRAQIKNALGGNTTMQIWLGKNILGQSDSPQDNTGNETLPWSDEVPAKEGV